MNESDPIAHAKHARLPKDDANSQTKESAPSSGSDHQPQMETLPLFDIDDAQSEKAAVDTKPSQEDSPSGAAAPSEESESRSAEDEPVDEAVAAGQRMYVIGHPIGHSKSPVMYRAVYRKLGVDWSYDIKDIPTADETRAFLGAKEYLSVNVTTPYKPLAYGMATVPAASARLAQGANLLVVKDGELIAYDTDGQGCIAYLERKGIHLAGKRVAVCGTGPTALAILHTAALAGADEVLLLSRDKAKSESVLRAYLDEYGQLAQATIDLPAARENHMSFRQAYQHATFKYGSYQTSTKAISSSDVIIDATPLGMNTGDPAPFDTALLSSGQVVLDTVYGHGKTALLSVQIVCDIAEVPVPYTFDQLFETMAEAAGFDRS